MALNLLAEAEVSKEVHLRICKHLCIEQISMHERGREREKEGGQRKREKRWRGKERGGKREIERERRGRKERGKGEREYV